MAVVVWVESAGLVVELVLEVAQECQGTRNPRNTISSSQSCKDLHCHRLGILHMWWHHPICSNNISCWTDQAKGLGLEPDWEGLEPGWEQAWDLVLEDPGNQNLQNKVWNNQCCTNQTSHRDNHHKWKHHQTDCNSILVQPTLCC